MKKAFPMQKPQSDADISQKSPAKRFGAGSFRLTPSLSLGRNLGIAALVATSLMGHSAQASTLTWDPSVTGTGSNGAGTWDNTSSLWSSGSVDTTFGSSAETYNTVAVSSGATTITVSNTTGLVVGQLVYNTKFPTGTTITAINGNVLTVSAAATGSIGGGSQIIFSTVTSDVVFGSGSGVAGTITVSGFQVADSLTINAATDGGNYTFTSGTITLGGRNGTTGNLTLASVGTTTINSVLNWKNTIFTSAGQTLSLGGGSLNNSPIGAFAGSITGSTLAIAKSSTVIVTAGVYASGGAGQMVNIGDTDAGTGGLIFAGGTTTMGGSFQAGNLTGTAGLIQVNGGLLNVTGQLFTARNGGANGRTIVNSGTLAVTNGNNGLRDASTHITFGAAASKSTGVMDINGGAFTTPGIIAFNEGNTGTGVNASTATLNITGGTSTIGTIQFGGYNALILATSGTSNVNISGGSTYIGTGGIKNINTGVAAAYNINLSGGATVGALENWSTGLAANVGTGGVTLQAANASSVAKNITWGGVLSGVGGITKTGEGNLILDGANTYSGGTTINAGTVTLGAGSGATQTVTSLLVYGATTATSASGVNTLTLSASTVTSLGLAIGQGVSIAGIPAGTTITGVNTSTGVVTLSANLTASVSSGTAITFLAVPTAAASVGSGTGATTITVGSVPTGLAVGMQIYAQGNNYIPANTYITAINGNVLTLSTPLTGTGISSGAILIFGGANQATVASTTGLGSGQSVSGSFANTVQDVTGATVVRLSGNATSLTPSTGTFASYAGTLGDTTGTLTVNTGGALDLNTTSQTVGALNGTGGSIYNNATATSSTLTVGNGDTSGSYAGTIADNTSGNGTVGFTKNGSGTQILTGANTYTGATTINGGKLAVNGSLAAGSAVTVNSGGSLGGSGSVGGSVNVLSGGHFAPGNSISTTFSTGALTLAAGSTTDVELGTASTSRTLANSSLTNDRTTVNGALSLSGTLNLINNSNAGALGSAGAGSYLIFTGASSVTGKFTNIVDVAGFHAAVDSTSTAGNVYVDLNYYANAALSNASGGDLTQVSATQYTLNLGAFGSSSGTHTATITLDNVLADAIYQDLLSGGFDVSGKGDFTLSGFDATLSGIASGDNVTLTVSFNTDSASAGLYSGTVLFNPTSVNASGTAALSQVSLGLEFEVVPEPATWAMLVGGLGILMGCQSYRRRRA